MKQTNHFKSMIAVLLLSFTAACASPQSVSHAVGLAFDSNVEGMGSSNFILDSNKARSVNVDVRGMLEALRNVYKSDRLVDEIMSAGNP